MTNKNHLDSFIDNNNVEVLSEYRNKIYENIQTLNSKEEKQTLWLLIVLLFYLALNNSTISTLTIGPITFNNSSLLPEIIPIVFIGISFSLHSIARHKQDLNQIFYYISSKTLKNFIIDEKTENTNYLYRMYLPFSAVNFVYYLFRNKPKKAHIIGAIILLSPLLILLFLPYLIICLMLHNLFVNHFECLLGKISFFISLWLFLILLFTIFFGKEPIEK